MKPTYKIVNIVAKVYLKMYLDLYKLANVIQDIDYEPEQFPGAILRLSNPKSTFLLFKNGKMICAGARTREDVEKAVEEVVKLVKKYKGKEPENFSIEE